MTQEVKLRRSQCNYQDENARFLLDCDFSKQYSHYYRRRFQKTKRILEYNCLSKWNSDIPIYSLSELAAVAPLFDFHEESTLNFGSHDRRRRFSVSVSPESPEPQSSASFELAKRPRSNTYASSPISTPKISSTQNRLTPTALSAPLSEPIESPILGPNVPTLKQSQKDSVQGFCIIIGTIFKRMRMQPDVVEELSKGDFHVNCERYLGHYVSSDDKLVLEDNEESIALTGNIQPGQFVTGIVVALLGRPIDECSQFYVHDICYAEPNRQLLYDDYEEENLSTTNQSKLLSASRPIASASPIYLLVVSGLGFSYDMEKQSNLTIALQGLIDFIWGGGKFEDDERSSQVSRILVVGDNLSQDRLNSDVLSSPPIDKAYLAGPSKHMSDDSEDIAKKLRQSRQVKPYTETLQSVQHLDDFFAELSKTIAVDVMPGNSDPSSHLMPQQPFHPCMFPKSCKFSTFNCTTNPFHAIYDNNVELLATSGQNVDIVSKFSSISDPIEVMKKHLLWGSSAPSAPDNLYSVPYEEEDPYVIDFIPDIYVAGCQEYYRSEYYYYNNVPQDLMASQSTTTPTDFIKIDPEQSKQHVEEESVAIEKSRTSINLGTTSAWIPKKKDRTLLLVVPKFCETFTCVLINLKNLNCDLLSFN